MSAKERYDAVVIGAGQAAVPLSTTLVRVGWKTALIEREHVGGTCINEGCTPTKTMVASARVAYLARRAADYGVHTGPVSVDMAKVRQRKRGIVDADTGQILGAAVLGIEGGEIMSVLQMAMMGRVPYTVLRDAVFGHPTLAESLNNLFMAIDA
jgi:pyruvate/2-oxoglutarate dehydrogenase complex dihydrolipoamide dehydrogenase (E3) component